MVKHASQAFLNAYVHYIFYSTIELLRLLVLIFAHYMTFVFACYAVKLRRLLGYFQILCILVLSFAVVFLPLCLGIHIIFL